MARPRIFMFAAALCAACGTNAAPPRDGDAGVDGQGENDAGPGPCASRRTYVQPDEGIDLLLGALRSARESIKIEIYLFTDDRLVAELARAVDRDVDVRVILDVDQDDNLGTKRQLDAAGVRTAWGNPAFRFTHQKSLLVDDRDLWIMTGNFTAASFTSNREYTVHDACPADVADARAVFDADWNRTEPTLAAPDLIVTPAVLSGRRRIESFLRGARRSIDVEAEAFSDDSIRSILALKRAGGLGVRVLLADPERVTSNAQAAGELCANGIDVKYLYAIFLHAKLAIADGTRAYVGSINFTTNSMDRNREMGVVAGDPTLVEPLVATFERDWAAGVPAPDCR